MKSPRAARAEGDAPTAGGGVSGVGTAPPSPPTNGPAARSAGTDAGTPTGRAVSSPLDRKTAPHSARERGIAGLYCSAVGRKGNDPGTARRGPLPSPSPAVLMGSPEGNGGEGGSRKGGERPRPARGPSPRPEASRRDDPPPAPGAGTPNAGGKRAKRMEQAAEIARKRAAHFATFDSGADAAEGTDAIHAGGDNIRTLGPWSSAAELISARDEARAAREARINARGDARDLEWEPRGGGGVPPAPPRVGAGPGGRGGRGGAVAAAVREVLAHGTLDASSLDGDDRVAVSRELSARRELTPAAARLLSDGAPARLVLPDCHQLDPEALSGALGLALTKRLEVLDLSFCGRGLTDKASEAFTRAAGFPVAPAEAGGAGAEGEGPGGGRGAARPTAGGARGGQESALGALRAMRLHGAYKLSDAGLARALEAAPGLERLAVPLCSRLTDAALRGLPALCGSLSSLDLSGCGGLSGGAIAGAVGSLGALRELRVDGLPGVGDAALVEIAEAAPDGLESLSVSRCGTPESGVGDEGLTAVARRLPGLRSLRVEYARGVTDDMLVELCACRGLEVLSLRHCAGVTDRGVADYLGLARPPLRDLCLNGVAGVAAETCAAVAQHLGGTLEVLDLSWCRKVSDNMCGCVTDACGRLAELRLWGCPQITPRFLEGHGRAGLAVSM